MRPASKLALLGCKGASYKPSYKGVGHSNFWRDWLTHTFSLTARIKSRCSHFEVRVLFEGQDDLCHVERLLLRDQGPWRAREVLLLADGRPVVWARTVVPSRSLRGPWFFLRGLGSRPLGARLFADPLIERSQFVFLPRYRLPQKVLVRTAPALRSDPYPARVARLRRKLAPAMLTEVLLPGLREISSDLDFDQINQANAY